MDAFISEVFHDYFIITFFVIMTTAPPLSASLIVIISFVRRSFCGFLSCLLKLSLNGFSLISIFSISFPKSSTFGTLPVFVFGVNSDFGRTKSTLT